MWVTGVECLKCENIIYSRHVHDFHYCQCGNVAIDGGRDYYKINYNSPNSFKTVKIELPINDWAYLQFDYNQSNDEFGWISKNDRKNYRIVDIATGVETLSGNKVVLPKKDDFNKEKLVEYIRDDNGRPFGAVVAIDRDKVGISICHPKDKWNRELAVKIAEGRAWSNNYCIKLPFGKEDKITHHIMRIRERAKRYYK